MIYLLAAIGVLAIAVLTWRAFGPDRDSPTTPRGTAPGKTPRKTIIAPDDDPEFLKKLDEQKTRDQDED